MTDPSHPNGPPPGQPFPPPPGQPPGLPSWTPPPPGTPPSSQPRNGGHTGLFVGLGAAALLVLVTGGFSLWWFAFRSTGPSYPSAWDPRVADITGFVERERGLTYDHPVEIDFLDDDAFNATVTSNENDLSDDDRANLDQAVSQLRALGLVHGNVDLLAEQNQLQSGGVLAVYDQHTKRVRVKGTELTPNTRVTLAHELTHALQDQNFDLTRLGSFETDAQNSNFRTIIEGDAVDIENAYIEHLSSADKQTYEDEKKQETDTAKTAIDDVPDVLKALMGAPYALGQPFIDTMRIRGGNAAIDTLLRDPPKSEEQIMNIADYLHDREPVTVDVPGLSDGQEHLDDGDFGAVGWLLTLGELVDPRTALQVVDGWGGDSYVLYKEHDKVCVKAAYRGATSADSDRAETAIGDWSAEMPAGSASVSRDGDTVLLTSCDPGADAGSDTASRSTMVLAYPTTRLQLIQSLEKQLKETKGGSRVKEDTVLCMADRFVLTLTPAEMQDQSSLNPTEVQDRMLNAQKACS